MQFFTLTTKENLVKETKVINSNDFESVIYIKIPDEISNKCELFRVDETAPENFEIEWVGHLSRMQDHPWIDVYSGFFDKSVGQHTYKFSFINKENDKVEPLYLSYWCQVDNPPKPYKINKGINPNKVIDYDRYEHYM